ncbi:hypothetical protein ABGF49_07780 [Helcococcus ovis]|uniref:hypothetical protein n=1 Tax=Helcococcus TaxID=31983 RepID=UPI0038B7E44B
MKLYIVTGPPCSGKTTYVKNNLKEKDIVFDSDEIARAFTYSKYHTVNKNGIVTFILRLRYQFINSLKSITIGDAYIIVTHITDSLLKQCSMYDYKIINMDTTIQECIDRLYKDISRPDKKEWEKIIKEYSPH